MTTQTTDITDAKEQELDTNSVIEVRREKLAKLREQKKNAFPNNFRRDSYANALHAKYDEKTKEELAETEIKVVVAGRIMLQRNMGKASFVQIQDTSGKIQLYVRKNDIKDGLYDDFKEWDIGDIIGARGKLFKTNTGELSVHVTDIELLTKSLRPLPDKWHGLSDQEIRYRQRYVDLIVNEDSRKTFVTRTKIVQALRNYLNSQDFMEVETPMMQVIPGGASARPFVTHHNALDMDMYLRIAPELYLKRLVVGGFERVYEINRNFRNEGVSTRHNPEFTMLEFYAAYADYNDAMELTEGMIKEATQVAFGKLDFEYQGINFDFSKPFVRLSLKQAILNYNSDVDIETLEDKAKLLSYCKSKGFEFDEKFGLGRLQLELFEVTVEEKLLQPTFITQYPTEVSPLARNNDDDDTITDRFELFIAGRELANGFSELNDAEDQAVRFKNQVEQKDAGDLEAMHYDSDYICALEYGMPPTAGLGIGVDRLVMLLTNSASIRDVVLFPHMRRRD